MRTHWVRFSFEYFKHFELCVIQILFDFTEGVLNYEAFNLCYTGTGLFGVYGVVDDHMMCLDFCETIVYNLHRFSRQITDAELEAAKNRLINQHLINTDGTYPQLHYFTFTK